MKRLIGITVGVIVVLAMMTVPAFAQSNTDASALSIQEQPDESENKSTSQRDRTPPGTMLSSLATSQRMEMKGVLAEAEFKQKLEHANSNAQKASTVNAESKDINDRLEDLREDRQDLTASYQDGEINESEYATRMAGMNSTIDALENRTKTVVNSTEDIPSEELEAQGVNVTALETLKQNASDMSGQEVREIARSLAGPPENKTTGPKGPKDTPANTNRTDETDSDDAQDADFENASAAIATAETAIDEAETELEAARTASNDTNETLTASEDYLNQSRDSLQAAYDATESNQSESALEHAEDAIDLAEDARDSITEADESETESGNDREEDDTGRPENPGNSPK